MTKKRLFIIDFMAMAFRNFHAFSRNPLSTASGFPTSSIFGCSQFLMKLLNDEKPEYIIAACDSPEKTFRHDIYPKYKANRSEMPEDLSKQLPALFRLLETMNIKIYSEPGFEADDIIGSMCVQWAKEDLDIYIVSGDKDFMQLIKPGVTLYAPKKAGKVSIIGVDGVKEYFGVTPEQVIDTQALIGDGIDNVPGVPGIGAKGAAKLINDFGTLDEIYKNLDSITNKRQKLGLEENKELAYLSKTLVTIKTDMPLPITLDQIKVDSTKSGANSDLLSFYKEMEFNALATKITSKLDSPSVLDTATAYSNVEKANEDLSENITAKPTPHKAANTLVTEEPFPNYTQKLGPRDYKVINTQSALAELLETLSSQVRFAFDTETTGLDIVSSKPIGISFSWEEGEGRYVPLEEEHLDGVSSQQVLSLFKAFFENCDSIKIAHNLKYDLQMLWNLDIEPVGPFEDTMLQAFLLNSSRMKFGIDSLCEEFLGIGKIKTTDLLGAKKDKSMTEVPLDVISEYACEDTDCCLRLFNIFSPQITAQGLTKVYKDIECPLIPILAGMERRGIYIDSGELAAISKKLSFHIEALQLEIVALAGQEFNLNSTKQLGEIIFEKLKIHEQLGITRLKKTKSGYSTDVSVLEKLSAHRLPAAILEYRTYAKLKNTYVDTLPELINSKTGRIHTSFHQTGAATGRLSSSSPNLQNIPIRSKMGKEIRKAFKAEDSSQVIISADYSQIELRVLAHLSEDEALIAAFKSGQDIHSATAATMFHKELSQVTDNDRSNAKAINYGLMYGMGPRRLSQTTGVSLNEAKSFIEAYFAGFPKIKGFLDSTVEFAREHEYSQTITGRRRPISGLSSPNGMTKSAAENMAKNSPIQGSAADLIKIAMIQLITNLEKSELHTKLLLQVHDELVFECPKSELETVLPLIKSSMESAMDLKVPLIVDIDSGNNWLEAH